MAKLDVIQVSEELRYSLTDTADPQLNYIEALERLIAVVNIVKDDERVKALLQPFNCRYN